MSLLISAYNNISSLCNMAAQTVIKGKIIYYGRFTACLPSKSRKLLKRKDTGWEQDRERVLSDSCKSPWLPKIISKKNQPETRVGNFMCQEETCLSICVNSSTQKQHLCERHDKALQECQKVQWLANIFLLNRVAGDIWMCGLTGMARIHWNQRKSRTTQMDIQSQLGRLAIGSYSN